MYELEYELEVDGLPPTLNQFYAGLHWGKRKKIVDEWHEKIAWALKVSKWPKPLSTPIGVITQQFSKRTPRDADGAIVAGKFMADCLVRLGYVPDDNPKYVAFHTVRSSKGKENKIIFHVVKFK